MTRKVHMICLVGPTAVGKTDVAAACASRLDSDVISCDSMQVYREVTIASNKPTDDQLARVRHHLIGDIGIEEEFNVIRYCHKAEAAINDLIRSGKVPVIVGGSGLYVKALMDGLDPRPPKDDAVRRKWLETAEIKGRVFLHDRLKERDPDAARRIHFNDQKRVIRALEVFELTGGEKATSAERGLAKKFSVAFFGLDMDRARLYQRIDERVDRMFDAGLVEEIRSLRSRPWSATARRLIGVKEILGYLDGEYDLDRARYLIKRNTRHYAKRQLTWFRRDERIRWLDVESYANEKDIAEVILNETS